MRETDLTITQSGFGFYFCRNILRVRHLAAAPVSAAIHK